MINIADIMYDSKIYGPGIRTVIWFQGCSLRCKGCINPQLWSFKKNREYDIPSLIDLVKSDKVTLLGGEPLDQIEIKELLTHLKEQNISIVLFTGYDVEEINQELYNCIENTCDMLISGRYIESKNNKNLYLRGSTNQQISLFNNLIDFTYADEEIYEVTFGDEVYVCGRANKSIFDLIEN